MIVKHADFITSMKDYGEYSTKGCPEVAFAGKSNVGKSSMINKLTNRSKLARTSATPGKTRLINVYQINQEVNFIDLPGYGYARTSKQLRGSFAKIITDYIFKCEKLHFLFVLVDIRLEPQKIDLEFINLLGEHGVPFGIIDLSLAPTPAIGDSVAQILEDMGLESCGAHGTTACLAMLNDAVKKGGVMASNHVGGLSGAFIPVSEDAGMIAAVERGALSIEKLEAMTAVCSVGLDMIAIPGDTPVDVICGIIADEISIGVVNTKTTAVRVIPAFGKGPGDVVEFGGLLGHAPVIELNPYSPAKFIGRGGRIPAPIHSLKN